MKNDNFPTHIDLMWPTLEALKKLGGSGTNEEILDKIIEIEKYPEEIQKLLPPTGNQTKLEYRAAWARSYLKLAKAIENSGVGVWAITKDGQTITKDEAIRRIKAVQKEYSIKRKNKTSKEPELEIENTKEFIDENNADWKVQLLDIVKKIPPDAFEKLCQRILRESGFIKVEVTGKSGDGGIDGVGIYRVNLLSFHVAFQCKRYQGSVSSPTIRDFRGAMIGRCDKGLIITTGSFTSEARKEATRDGAPAIDLIDGEELCQLLKNLKLGVETKIIEECTVQPEWFERF
ncbi:MAG TPA: restriction endonuclease [Alphaproteobacteria bacterium]|nr:restriction endonuclease [Alphaproteobacteria bacterium]